MPNANPSEPPDSRQAVTAIVRRARNLTATERRRLGRWTSASLRDPRYAVQLERARERALAVLDDDPDRRKRWDNISSPLHEELLESTKDAKRWRLVMLACHLAALLGQDVVGAAGRRRVHGLDADAPGHQGLQPGCLREPDACSAAEDHHLGLHLRQLLEMGGR